MKNDINKKPYTEETKLKLNIFREFFREWLPVFIYNQSIKEIHIFDFFAGSGTDILGEAGSAINIIKEFSNGYCNKIKDKNIHFLFNELNTQKINILKTNVQEYIFDCLLKNNCTECNIHDFISYSNEDFNKMIQEKNLINIFKKSESGKFVLLDQYGFKAVDEATFMNLVQSPKTDFIFFISSSTIKRFQESYCVKKYFGNQLNFDVSKPQECHKVVAEYYKKLLPRNTEYYLHSFSIKNGSNYYGLIFGTNHSLGMEKFLRVCWKIDKYAGESNFNINNDFEEGSLYFDPEKSVKKKRIQKEVENKVLDCTIQNNLDGLKYVLKEGGQPTLFVEVLQRLKKEQKVELIGKVNYQATNIHKVPKYEIKVVV
jgi:three-Cys-motif partner protein